MRTLLAPEPDRLAADLAALAALADPEQPGWTRVAMTDAELAARRWAADAMRVAGLEVRTDAAGNVVGRLPGTDPTRPALMTGSHLDTVEGGGRFDGTVGVVGALEAVRLLRESDLRLAHDLWVVAFFDEEPNRFGLSCLGSRAMAGRLTAEHLERCDPSGVRLRDALATAGIDPGGLASARLSPGSVRAYLELHIEQGPLLQEQGSTIGLVTSITGLSRFRALFTGVRAHAGTTPMTRRADAGCAAAGTVLAVERIASAHDDVRGTVGAVTLTPAAVNVVSGSAVVTGELRSPDDARLAQARSALAEAAQAQGAPRGVDVQLDWVSDEPSVSMAGELLELLDGATRSLGYRQSRLYSGAEHDAAVIAGLCPVGMVFVPSKDGHSHCPQEWTDITDVTAGVHVLTEALVGADQLEPSRRKR